MAMEKLRVENDSQGSVEIPADAMYGAQTMRAINNFPISGLRPYRSFIWAIGFVKYCAATVNFNLGLLPDNLYLPIAAAALEVVEGKLDLQFVVDPFQAGAGTSHNMNANEVIANRAGQILGKNPGDYPVNPNDHVNMSQSTNDVIPTAIRLGCLWRLPELISSCNSLSTELWNKSSEFDGILKSGRTHLQDAVPIRLGQEFGAYARAVERDTERISRAADGLRRLGIGGTAAGTGLNADPNYRKMMVSSLTQFTGIRLEASDNLFESMQSMADMVDYSSSMRTMALTLIRIANDLRLLSSGPDTGLDEINFSPLQPGSSIMPGKVNPVMAEMLNMAMYHIVGCDTTVMLASQAGQLELNVMMPVIAHSLFEMMHIMINSIHQFTEKGIKGITANRNKNAKWLENNSIIVTALNPLIGYAAGASLVKEARSKNMNLKELAFEKANRGELFHRGTEIPVSKDEIINSFSDIYKMTEGGIIS
jgi:fumarate hydratase class II